MPQWQSLIPMKQDPASAWVKPGIMRRGAAEEEQWIYLWANRWLPSPPPSSLLLLTFCSDHLMCFLHCSGPPLWLLISPIPQDAQGNAAQKGSLHWFAIAIRATSVKRMLCTALRNRRASACLQVLKLNGFVMFYNWRHTKASATKWINKGDCTVWLHVPWILPRPSVGVSCSLLLGCQLKSMVSERNFLNTEHMNAFTADLTHKSSTVLNWSSLQQPHSDHTVI